MCLAAPAARKGQGQSLTRAYEPRDWISQALSPTQSKVRIRGVEQLHTSDTMVCARQPK